MSPFDLVGLLAVLFAGVKILGPVAEAMGDRIRGRRTAAADPALTAEIEQLRDRLAEAEERLDFAERLLASRDHPEPLPGGVRR